jgi:hypothetical protein
MVDLTLGVIVVAVSDLVSARHRAGA